MKYDATQTTILGIPPYIFWTGIGVMIAVLVLNIILYKRDLDVHTYTRTLYLSFIPLGIGAKVLGVVYTLLYSWYVGTPITIDTFINAGLVYYGGLFAFLFSLKTMCRRYDKTENDKFFDAVAVYIPLFHVFGRIGCFMAGCCYGVECKGPFSVLYTTVVEGSLHTAWRFPTPLFEAGLNLLLGIVLLTFLVMRKWEGKLLNIYIMVYATYRFFLEFLRDDWHVPSGLTGGQYLSIIILLIVIIKEWRAKRRYS